MKRSGFARLTSNRIMDRGSVATDNGVCTKPSEYVTM
jgi:hypothetical protein